jgi:membrane protein YdbS with pleckstrin-like domain
VWAGYHPRAAAPALAAAAGASLLVWIGRWYFAGWSESADRLGAPAVFALVWCVWPALGALYLYRAVTYSYRLTDRAVLTDFGFRHRPVPPVWLRQVESVRTGAGRLSAALGVGWVEVRTADRVVRLVGVRHPEALAEAIRRAIADVPRGERGPV